MKHSFVTYTPFAEVEFSKDELLLMFECSMKHYDRHCRSYSLEGHTTGELGLLRGMLNAIDNGFAGPRRLSFDQVDTLAKIVEVGQYMTGDKPAQAFSLGFALRKVLIALNDSLMEPKPVS